MDTLLINIFAVTAELAPWLFLGIVLSSVIHSLVPDSFFRKHLGGRGVSAVIKSVLIGVPMPLCSCSVIPVALSLKKQGAGNPASLSFLISTPQTGLDSVFVSASLLGWPFAIFKLVSALVLGLLGGVISIFLQSPEEEVLQSSQDKTSGRKFSWREVYDYAIDDLLYMIWKWLLLGILISAAITTWLPQEVLASLHGQSILVVLLGVLLASIPLYICATSSVPIAAALVASGLPTSAALVFLMAGPATNIATIGAVYKTLGFRQLIIYLVVIITGSLGLAYAFDHVVVTSNIHMHHEHLGVLSHGAAVLLVLFFGKFLISDFSKSLKPQDVFNHKKTVTFDVDGMTCQGCVNKINKAFAETSRISVSVNFENKQISFSGDVVNSTEIISKLESLGFVANISE
ncbi:MAG: permease [Lentisphaerales bacterium]|nr:permease [Lentisphaerales bacterium]